MQLPAARQERKAKRAEAAKPGLGRASILPINDRKAGPGSGVLSQAAGRQAKPRSQHGPAVGRPAGPPEI